MADCPRFLFLADFFSLPRAIEKEYSPVGDFKGRRGIPAMPNEQPQEKGPMPDLNFRPLGLGLGFHKEDREGPTRPGSFSSPGKERRQRREYLRNKVGKSHRIKAPRREEVRTQEDDQASISPPVYLRTGAYLTDIAFVILGAGMTVGFFSLILLGGFDYRPFLAKEMALGLVLLYSLYHLAYFTLMESSPTLGKELFGMKTLATGGLRPSLYQTFLRSLVTLLSVFVFFLPLLFRSQDKISHTKVVRR